MTFEKGCIVKIEGGSDAYLMQSYLDSRGDDGAYRFAHAGWGTDDRADWGAIGMDSEPKYGTVLVAIGRNIFDAPALNCGLGGVNRTTAHCDICCRNTSFWLDGK
jgi:2,5-dihydroxypyridine 5,6-dioxygenase